LDPRPRSTRTVHHNLYTNGRKPGRLLHKKFGLWRPQQISTIPSTTMHLNTMDGEGVLKYIIIHTTVNW
jgi:hypothetical protein